MLEKAIAPQFGGPRIKRGRPESAALWGLNPTLNQAWQIARIPGHALLIALEPFSAMRSLIAFDFVLPSK